MVATQSKMTFEQQTRIVVSALVELVREFKARTRGERQDLH